MPAALTRSRVTGAALAAAVAALFAAGPADAAATVTTSRLQGPGRIETAAAIAAASFPAAENVVIARADDFPDALSGNYLASYLHAPILLTESARLSPATRAQLDALGAERVYLLGQTEAISAGVQGELEDAGYAVTRIGGADRLVTSQQIAQFPDGQSGESEVGTLGTSGRTAIVSRADVAADALSGGPVSYAGTFPTILTDRVALSDTTRTALTDLGIEYALVLGGPEAVSPAVEAAIEGMGITTQRIQGPTRTDTAAAIADFAQDQLGFTAGVVNLARGDLFPDALTGGPRGGLEKQPMLLTNDPDDLSPGTRAWLDGHDAFIRQIEVLGGPEAVSDATVADARDAATS